VEARGKGGLLGTKEKSRPRVSVRSHTLRNRYNDQGRGKVCAKEGGGGGGGWPKEKGCQKFFMKGAERGGKKAADAEAKKISKEPRPQFCPERHGASEGKVS